VSSGLKVNKVKYTFYPGAPLALLYHNYFRKKCSKKMSMKFFILHILTIFKNSVLSVVCTSQYAIPFFTQKEMWLKRQAKDVMKDIRKTETLLTAS